MYINFLLASVERIFKAENTRALCDMAATSTEGFIQDSLR